MPVNPSLERTAAAAYLNRACVASTAQRPFGMPLYHVTLNCSGLTEAEGSAGARNVEAGFRERPWHRNVACRWDGTCLWIEADNNYDSDGGALCDEFWDEVIANINFSSSIRIEIVSVKAVGPSS